MPTGPMGTWPERANDAIGQTLPSKVAHFFTPRMIVMLSCRVRRAVPGVRLYHRQLAPIVVIPHEPNMAQTHHRRSRPSRCAPTVWQTRLRAVGSLHAVEGADLGFGSRWPRHAIGFSAGEDVRKGTLLVQLRDDSERASAEEALLTYKRYAALIKTQAISQSNYDSALANMKSTRAAVEKKAIRAPYRRAGRHPAGRHRPICRTPARSWLRCSSSIRSMSIFRFRSSS